MDLFHIMNLAYTEYLTKGLLTGNARNRYLISQIMLKILSVTDVYIIIA